MSELEKKLQRCGVVAATPKRPLIPDWQREMWDAVEKTTNRWLEQQWAEHKEHLDIHHRDGYIADQVREALIKDDAEKHAKLAAREKDFKKMLYNKKQEAHKLEKGT